MGIEADLLERYSEGERDDFYKFKPHAQQLRFIESTKRIVGLFGANRSGKSECGGWFVAAFARGELPSRVTPPNPKIWIIGLDEKMLRDVAWRKMRRYLPQNMIAELRERAGDYYLRLKNGAEIWGKSCASGAEKFAGQDIDLAHFDEEPEEGIWRETQTRLVDRRGILSIAMTPILGSPWLYTQVYAADDPSIEVVTLSMWDNPYIPDANKQEFVEQLRRSGCHEDEIQVRVEGKYILWGGRNVFQADVIALRLKQPEPPLVMQGRFVEGGSFFRDYRGEIRIWDLPDQQHNYVIGADAAQGTQSDRMDAAGDFSAAHVYDLVAKLQVAEIHGRIDPDMFATQLLFLGRMYNDALIAVEAEKFGVAVLKELSYEAYPRIYMQRPRGKRHDEATRFMGWAPDQRSKAEAIKDLRMAIRSGQDGIRSRKLLEELVFYVYDERGRANAMSGKHDDLVTSFYITIAVAFETPELARAKSNYPVGSAGHMKHKLLNEAAQRTRRRRWRTR